MYFFNPSLLLPHNHQLQELLKEEKKLLAVRVVCLLHCLTEGMDMSWFKKFLSLVLL